MPLNQPIVSFAFDSDNVRAIIPLHFNCPHPKTSLIMEARHAHRLFISNSFQFQNQIHFPHPRQITEKNNDHSVELHTHFAFYDPRTDVFMAYETAGEYRTEKKNLFLNQKCRSVAAGVVAVRSVNHCCALSCYSLLIAAVLKIKRT